MWMRHQVSNGLNPRFVPLCPIADPDHRASAAERYARSRLNAGACAWHYIRILIRIPGALGRSWPTTAKEPKSVGSTRIRAPVQRTKLPGSEWLRIGKSSRKGLMTRGGSGLKLFQWAPPGL